MEDLRVHVLQHQSTLRLVRSVKVLRQLMAKKKEQQTKVQRNQRLAQAYAAGRSLAPLHGQSHRRLPNGEKSLNLPVLAGAFPEHLPEHSLQECLTATPRSRRKVQS